MKTLDCGCDVKRGAQIVELREAQMCPAHAIEHLRRHDEFLEERAQAREKVNKEARA